MLIGFYVSNILLYIGSSYYDKIKNNYLKLSLIAIIKFSFSSIDESLYASPLSIN